MPASAPGMTIGLFGGSFNPPHEGHRLVSEQVLKRLGLDAVWWLVTPGNPLKDHGELAPLPERVEAARKMMRLPDVHVTGFEAAHGFRYTFDTLSFLRQTMPSRHFVWIMGADSLMSFHRWDRWRDIAGLMPLAIYARPGASKKALFSRAATALARFRYDELDAPLLPYAETPAWVFLTGLMSALSSTEIRARLRQNGSA
ncbi:MAG: nicotinate-nucleotide adenylyltransferase [Hyphomicrobiaceae bacterium]|nr:nicotinate-nucleotide adenylyltransferase [Hyphomicrobiaceae bacterium]